MGRAEPSAAEGTQPPGPQQLCQGSFWKAAAAGTAQQARETGRERAPQGMAVGGGCRRRRARLSGKPKRAELTSMRLKRALSLGASCTPGISAVGRPAGCTRSCRGLPQWDATGSGTQRTPLGGPGEIPAHAKMAGEARPHIHTHPHPRGTHAQNHVPRQASILLLACGAPAITTSGLNHSSTLTSHTVGRTLVVRLRP